MVGQTNGQSGPQRRTDVRVWLRLSSVNLPPISGPSRHRWRLGDFLLVWVAGFITSLIGALIGIAVGVGGSAEDILDLGVSPELLFWVVLPAQFFGMLLALAWVSQRRGSGNFTRDFGLSIKGQDAVFLFFGMVVFLALSLALSPFAAWIGSDETPQVTVQAIQEIGAWPTRIIVALVVVVVTPIVEELTFRGLLLRYLQERLHARSALFLSALLFGLFHLLGATGAAAATIAMVQTFLAGLVLAYLTQRSGSLSRAIFTHGGFNLFTVLILYFAPNLPV